MNVHSTRQWVIGLALACTLAIVAACSGTSPSMNPTAPTAAAASAGANFSPNPDCDAFPESPECQPPPCDPSTDTCPCDAFPDQPHCQPPPPPGDCSPGYFKNHQETWVGIYCDTATYPRSCASLLTALTCRGSDASCGRHEASGYLNSVTGCTESD